MLCNVIVLRLSGADNVLRFVMHPVNASGYVRAGKICTSGTLRFASRTNHISVKNEVLWDVTLCGS
jgi:hypothetical protein